MQLSRLAQLKRLSSLWRILLRLGLNRDSYLVRMGWFESYLNGQSTVAGQPVPWYNYAAIDFVSSRLKPEMYVFEYGAGNSTRWYAERVTHVIACEHDHAWADIVRQKLPQNATLVERALGDEYVSEIGKHGRHFDLVVIDGRMRSACAKQCLAFLSSNGVIIWDNSDRPEYREGTEMLEAAGFRRIDFTGMGPIATIGTMTSVFYRSHNIFGI